MPIALPNIPEAERTPRVLHLLDLGYEISDPYLRLNHAVFFGEAQAPAIWATLEGERFRRLPQRAHRYGTAPVG
jgi:hypothetical protein